MEKNHALEVILKHNDSGKLFSMYTGKPDTANLACNAICYLGNTFGLVLAGKFQKKTAVVIIGQLMYETAAALVEQ